MFNPTAGFASVHSQELLVIDMSLLYHNFLVLLINCHLSITCLFSPICIHWGLSVLAPGCGLHFVENPGGVIVDCFLQFVYMIVFVVIVFPHIPSLSMYCIFTVRTSVFSLVCH